MMNDITEARKRVDRLKLTNVATPRPLSSYIGLDIQQARESVMTDCYKFLNEIYDVGGFELLKLFDGIFTVLDKKVSEEEETKILEARRESVKMARQMVRQSLPSELQWMYGELKEQGIVDVVRDAVIDGVDEEFEEDAGYDLDEEDFSDDES